MDKEIINGISLLKSSDYRYKIMKSIGNDMKTPSEISNMIGIRLNHVSMFLSELKRNGLIECLNEENRKGRLYRITELGKDVLSRTKK